MSPGVATALRVRDVALRAGVEEPRGPGPGVLEPEVTDVGEVVRAGLRKAATALEARGIPVPPLEGKLLRPLLAYALVPPHRRAELDERFWFGALAVQMAHEASLVHDDIVDGAAERRGAETAVARLGVGPALVLGDHYLTGAYRAAALTGSDAFLRRFVIAVERTVAGEISQGRAAGARLDPERYEAVVVGKSGELFGAAAALGGAVLGLDEEEARVSIGHALGALYQRVDDLLDYCPAARTGKPPMQDYRAEKWTWVLDLAPVDGFGRDEADVVSALFAPLPRGLSPAREAVRVLAERRAALLERIEGVAPGDDLAARLVRTWTDAAEAGVVAQERRSAASPGLARASEESVIVEAARVLADPGARAASFTRNARTFRFASRLFGAEELRRVSGLYAFCRFTDDLVDDPHDGAPPERLVVRLAAWRALARSAWEGRPTGVALLDDVLGEARRAGVAWRYPDALLDGVAMDLERVRYDDWADLERYTFGVAGAVGGWMTQLFGLDEPSLLERAHALGHGMQLTNIVRDVGEDWAVGRLYLPRTLLDAYDVDEGALDRAVREGALPARWPEAMEAVMARADAHYAEAWPGIRVLPDGFRRPVAVAASAYRAIHGAVRRNGYDNLGRRARTRLPGKVAAACVGLIRGRRLR